MAKRESVIKWKNEDKKNLKKAVSDFNKKVQKLKKTRKSQKIHKKVLAKLLKVRYTYRQLIKSTCSTSERKVKEVLTARNQLILFPVLTIWNNDRFY